MINLDNLTELQVKRLKNLADYCYKNEENFKIMISVKLLDNIQQLGLNTRWNIKESAEEFKEYASKSLKICFPYMNEQRILEEVNNIRTKNTINIYLIIRELLQIHRQLNNQ